MEFDLDLDLEDLNLKSVDMGSTNSQGKNISFDTNNSFRPNIREQSPNLTVSTNNHDAMPSGHMCSTTGWSRTIGPSMKRLESRLCSMAISMILWSHICALKPFKSSRLEN